MMTSVLVMMIQGVDIKGHVNVTIYVDMHRIFKRGVEFAHVFTKPAGSYGSQMHSIIHHHLKYESLAYGIIEQS